MTDSDVRIAGTIERIGTLDEAAMRAARERQGALTKPPGSLGRLEDIAVQIAGITGKAMPTLRDRAVILMAADHGVAVEGVSAYPREVTAQMVANFLHGGAAINVLARAAGARVVVVDMGVAAEIADERLVHRRVRAGTSDFARTPAMTRAEACQAIASGVDVVEAEARRGLDLVALADMGIGNTTAASAIVAALSGAAADLVTGRGTGIDDQTYARKVAIVREALALHRPDPSDAVDVLTKVGGFEIAGLVGVVLAAAARRIPVLVDGFITGAAALAAVTMAPRAREFLIAGHRSPEPGHRVVLERLGLVPLLDLGLRLGEGSGAALAMSIVDAALRLHREMATFSEAGVTSRA